MSEICALLRRDGGPVDAVRLEAAAGSMRGTGGGPARCWIDDRAGVGLAVVPQAATPEDLRDVQPAVSADGTVALVADARIDNRGALARELGIAAADGAPDSALILAAYLKWGDRAAERLIGDFAIVVWDGRRRRLWCARDQLGQRTLAYRDRAGTFAVASSPAAVARLDGAGVRLDLDKVAEFLVRAEDPARTFHEGVKHLAAGHTLDAGAGGERLRAYWRLEDIRPVRLRSDGEYLEAFRSIWAEAVSCRLRSVSPLGVMLSGGLDSSAVAGTTAAQLRARGERLFAYHAAPVERFAADVRAGWIAEETEDVRALAAMHDNFVLEVLRPDGRTFLDDPEGLFHHAGIPMPNADNRHWFEGILRRACGQGVRVMLGGYKGNATISYTGVRGLRLWAYTGRWRKLAREAGALARVRGRRARAIVREMVVPPLPPRLLELLRAAKGRPLPPLADAFPTAIHPDFLRERRVEQRVRELGLDPRLPDRSLGRTYRIRIMKRTGDAADLYRGLRALYGVEFRDPTADLRVVEFCLGVPDDQYLRDGRERLLIRRAMEGTVADQVLQRRTRGAQAPDWHQRLTAARPRMFELLDRLAASDTARRCLDLGRLRSLVDRWPAAPSVAAEPDYRLRLATGLHTGAFLLWFESLTAGAAA